MTTEEKGPKSNLEAMMLAGVKTFPLLIGIMMIAGGVGHHRVGALLVGSVWLWVYNLIDELP
jgi:hypothetical protein